MRAQQPGHEPNQWLKRSGTTHRKPSPGWPKAHPTDGCQSHLKDPEMFVESLLCSSATPGQKVWFGRRSGGLNLAKAVRNSDRAHDAMERVLAVLSSRRLCLVSAASCGIRFVDFSDVLFAMVKGSSHVSRTSMDFLRLRVTRFPTANHIHRVNYSTHVGIKKGDG